MNWLLFFGIVLVGANLRAPLTSVGVALPSIKDALSLSNVSVSVITIIPLLAFSVISLLASRTGERLGLEKTIFYALILILLGVAIRSIPNVSLLYVGTILIGVGIAFGNVLTPAVIKSNFPMRLGIMTGYYTVVMNVFGSLSSYISAPLVKSFNYQIALGSIGVVTLVTLFVWVFQLKNNEKIQHTSHSDGVNVWKSPIAWRITLLMGSQSLIFYALINWLPAYLADYGVSLDTAGVYLSILQLAIIPLTFVTPIWATKMRSQVLLTIITCLFFVVGIVIITFFPRAALIGILILGITNGISFGLVNTFFSLKTEQPITAAKLSGMSQSVGYLFAATGPLLFGVLHDVTGTWLASLSILLIVSLAMLIFTPRAGRSITIEAKQKQG
ncbi:MFS transporter [Staphylococcus sp. H16/1A]|uniref:MFS transporter n=2 Tax=Staphylococcus canis TaxID=2724942 RepID=A0ABS0TBC7_9STAP|nr:MFS transporter [Staphylococcus canis]